MGKAEAFADAESLMGSMRRALAQAPSQPCQTYHIDFFRCVIRKSFSSPQGGVGGA